MGWGARPRGGIWQSTRGIYAALSSGENTHVHSGGLDRGQPLVRSLGPAFQGMPLAKYMKRFTLLSASFASFAT